MTVDRVQLVLLAFVAAIVVVAAFALWFDGTDFPADRERDEEDDNR